MGKNKIVTSLVLATVIVSLSSQCVYAKNLQPNNENKINVEEQQVTVEGQQKRNGKNSKIR